MVLAVIVREALRMIARLIVSVRAEVAAVVVISPPRVIELPLRVKALVAVFVKFIPPITVAAVTLLLAAKRVLPAKVMALAKFGSVSASQLAAVFQSLSAPPPSQICPACEKVRLCEKAAIEKSAAKMRLFLRAFIKKVV